MNMREKIAVAISGAPFPSKASLRKADAVLDVLMEPTPEMLATCWPLHHPWGRNAPPPSERQALFDEVVGKVRADWRAMIQAAKEGK